jgi:UMF1 family MFS transporter
VQSPHSTAATDSIDEGVYRRRVNAWCMYDWANSAFATTILGAVLPIYYSQVAGATLPSEAVATSYWSVGLSISLLIVAVLSPILGTISDVMRGKKRFLSIFAGAGIIATGLLVLVDTGDWLLASLLFVLGRIGFTASVVFYDALLPHVAREGDQDRVSTRGYALGYLGGGLLLAINVVMIRLLPGTWGPRLSFLSVAVWWAIFSIPVLTRVPEPPAATAALVRGMNVVTTGFNQLWATLKDIRRYSELFKYLLAFLIYNDGIGTIIGVAAIYGAELGFGEVELILALLLVQFVGIPFSLVFGRLPSGAERRRPLYLAFILFNLVTLPIVGIVGRASLAAETTGAPLPAYQSTAGAVGEGVYDATDPALVFTGDWGIETVSADKVGADADVPYRVTGDPGARLDFTYNGQEVEIVYSTGPDRGIWAVEMDGQPYLDEDSNEPLEIDGYHDTVRYGVRRTFTADADDRRRGGGLGPDPAEQSAPDPGVDHRPAADWRALCTGVGETAVLRVSRVDGHPPQHHPRSDRLCRYLRLGLFPRLHHRVLAVGLDGGHGPGRQPGSQPQPLCQHVAGGQERRVLWAVRRDGKVLGDHWTAAVCCGRYHL